MQKWVVPAGVPLTKFSAGRISGRKLGCRSTTSSQADSAVETSMSNSANEEDETDSSKISTFTSTSSYQHNLTRTRQMSPGFPLQRATRAPSFDPVLQGAPQVVYENNPRQSGAISEHTRVYHAQDRVVFESQPKPHHAIGHFSKSRADHPDQTIFENQAPQMRPIDLYEPRNQGLTSPSRQQQSSSAALIYRSEPPAHLNGDDQRSNAGSQYGSLPQVHQTTTDRSGGIMQQRNTEYQSHQQYHHEQQKVYQQQQQIYQQQQVVYSGQNMAPSTDSLASLSQYQPHQHTITVPALPRGSNVGNMNGNGASSAPRTLPKPQLSREQLTNYQQQHQQYTSSFEQRSQSNYASLQLPEQYHSTPSLNAAPSGSTMSRGPRVPQLKPFDVEYQRKLAEQRRIEREAMRQRESQQLEAYQKQLIYEQTRASLLQVDHGQQQQQQQQLQQQQHQHNQQQALYGSRQQIISQADDHQRQRTPQTGQDSAGIYGSHQDVQQSQTSWKRQYPVQIPRPEDVVQSQQDLYNDDEYKEAYYVDLLARRDVFVERPEEEPQVQRVGRRWQPPPEKPKPLFIPRQPLRAFDAQDDGEHRWRPQIYEPEYKYERKNFTPSQSPTRLIPELSPLPGSLDEANRRQMVGVLPASQRPRMPPIQVAMRVVSPQAQQSSAHRTRSLISESSMEVPSPAPVLYQDTPVVLKPHPSTLTLRDQPSQSGGVRKYVQQLEHVRSHTPQPQRPPQQPQPMMRQRSSSNPHSMIRINTQPYTQTTIQQPPQQQQYRHHNYHPQQQQQQQQQQQLRPYHQQHLIVPRPQPQTSRTFSTQTVIYPNPQRLTPNPQRQSQHQQQRFTPITVPLGHIPPAPQIAAFARSQSLGELSVWENMQKRLLDDDTMSPLNELAAIRARLEEKARLRQVEYRGMNSEIQKVNAELEARPPIHVPPPKPASPIERSQSVTVMEGTCSQCVPLITPMQDYNHYKLVSPETTDRAVGSDDSGYQASTDVSTTTWQFSENAFSPRSVISVNGGYKDDAGLLKVRTDLSDSMTDRTNARAQTYQSSQMNGMSTSTNSIPPPSYPYMLVPVALDSRYNSLPHINNTDRMQSTLVKIQDENSKKPNKSIMKRGEGGKVAKKDAATKTEEITRVEEIERTIRTHKRKDKNKHRHSQNGGRQMIEYNYQNGGDSGSMYNRYPPMAITNNNGRIDETWTRQTTTRRERDNASQGYRDNGSYRGSFRSANQQDTLRRGDAKYLPNGELRERRHSTHRAGSRQSVNRSSSQRDLYGGYGTDVGGPEMIHRRTSSYAADSRRNSMMAGQSPIIEYPPTLPRGPAPAPPPHRNIGHNQLAKTRSYQDWENDGRNRDEWAMHMRRYGENDQYTPLKREFDTHVAAPLPSGHVDEHDHRTENIPGGYETFSRDSKANQGKREGPNGAVTHFNESKQEVSYKRETGNDDRRRR